MRSVEEGAAAGDQRSQLAIDVYVHRIRKYLGAYLVHLKGRVDAIVFSAGKRLGRLPALLSLLFSCQRLAAL